MSTILPVIGAFLQLLLLILGEIFGSQARAREKEKQYREYMQKFDESVRLALAKMLEEARRESELAKPLEDRIDEKLP